MNVNEQASLNNLEDMVLVPRRLLGAAAHALDTGSEAPKTLAEIRQYSLASTAELGSWPSHEAVTLQAIAAEAGVDLSGLLPDAPLSRILIDAIRNK